MKTTLRHKNLNFFLVNRKTSFERICRNSDESKIINLDFNRKKKTGFLKLENVFRKKFVFCSQTAVRLHLKLFCCNPPLNTDRLQSISLSHSLSLIHSLSHARTICVEWSEIFFINKFSTHSFRNFFSRNRF